MSVTSLTWCGGAAYGEAVRVVRDEAADDSVEVAETVTAIASAMSTNLPSLADDLRGRLSAEIEYLGGDERLLQALGASVEANMATLLYVLGNRADVTRAETPAAAIDYARRLAQRGIPVDALVRCYRLGQDSFLRWCLEELKHHSGDGSVVSAAAQELVGVTSAYIDRATQRVVAEYEDERDRWALNQGAVRAARVRDLVEGRALDLDATENVLGYRLRQQHLGLVLWGDRDTGAESLLPTLERVVRTLGERLGCLIRPLFVPWDELSAWVWLPLGQRPGWDTDTMAAAADLGDTPVRVAVGAPGGGVRGFRRSHQQAIQAQAVAVAGRAPAPSFTAFGEVGPIALMCSDLDATRSWVQDVLGDLALDDEPHARLRETVHAFLSCGGSYAAAAVQLGIHKNSVQYRLRKAEEVLGWSIRDDRFNVEVALSACRWLGKSVLLAELA